MDYNKVPNKVNVHPEKKVEKVIEGSIKENIEAPIKEKKKDPLARLASAFIAEDIGNIRDYVVTDVIVPGLKNIISGTSRTILNSIQDAIDIAIYGEIQRGQTSKKDYTKCWSNRDHKVSHKRDISEEKGGDYKNVSFRRKSDAETVLRKMRIDIQNYDNVSIADFYQYTGRDPDNYTFNNFGWTNLDNVRIDINEDGFYIRFPDPVRINT